MAKKHFNKINKIITQLEALQSEVDSLRDERQDNFDNMSDSRQESDYGEDLRISLIHLMLLHVMAWMLLFMNFVMQLFTLKRYRHQNL